MRRLLWPAIAASAGLAVLVLEAGAEVVDIEKADQVEGAEEEEHPRQRGGMAAYEGRQERAGEEEQGDERQPDARQQELGGPVGAGAKAQTADIIAFARTKGVYGGINIEGSAITINDSANSNYYGRPVGPLDILIRRTVRNRGADGLRITTAGIARGRRR